MIHYNAWFSFKEGTSEGDQMQRVRAVLGDRDDAADVRARLERIKQFTKLLVSTQADSADAREIAKKIERELAAAHEALKPARS